MKAFGIFEGGGAKGLAHIGALKASEERQIEYLGIAGTSAGAIVAALIAAGCKADDLYNPHGDSEYTLDKNFLDFFDTEIWDKLGRFKQALVNILQRNGGMLKKWASINRTLWKNRELLRHFFDHHGFFTTEEFISWFEPLLVQALQKPPSSDQTIKFLDIPIPLKIIATDLTNRCIKIYSQRETPNVRVAEAVAASITIPFVFKPTRCEEHDLVDGGILSNFPAWVFDEERRNADVFTPTMGFRLVEKNNQPGFDTLPPLFKFFNNLAGSVLVGDELLHIRRVENLYIIPLKVRANTFDFDMNVEKKEALYSAGYYCANKFFNQYIGPRNPDEMKAELELLYPALLRAFGKGDVHLRINIMMPINKEQDRLRILYSINMEEDTDDQLELAPGVGAAGQCWIKHGFALCDMKEARVNYRKAWRLDKYQQALVRPTLKSLLCVPIFDHKRFDKRLDVKENPLVGILNFDSDDLKPLDFLHTRVMRVTADIAKTLARKLNP